MKKTLLCFRKNKMKTKDILYLRDGWTAYIYNIL